MKSQIEDKPHGMKAWLLAARPKTLTGAAVPVIMALALAYADMEDTGFFQWIPALLCLLFAFVMQIDANFVNDYFDFKHGNDDETRLGPKRACAMGWVTPEAMFRAILITTVVGCLIGLPLVLYGGWQMVIVGVLCVLFCFLYTTTLSYWGLGDVLVLVFFGIVPVCCTYYLQLHTVTFSCFLASVACGLVIDTLLILNNFRDIDNDRRAGKRTLIVFVGKKTGYWLYVLCGIVGLLLAVIVVEFEVGASYGFWIVYLLLHGLTSRDMKRIDHGKELNKILGQTARNMFIFGLFFAIRLIIGVI